jgi:site-specific DNA-adenine methylase
MSKVLPYLGGKSQIASEIISHFPRGPKVYVEPFFGGGGVYFEVPAGLYQSRCVNDINNNVMTFFRALRDRRQDLEEVCRLTPYSKSEWDYCGQLSTGLNLEDPKDQLELARRLWVRQSQGFAGRQEGGSPAWARKGAKGPDLATRAANSVDLFQEAAEQLIRTEIDCIDALQFIGKYAGPNCFIYEDPPYHPSTRVGQSTIFDTLQIELTKFFVPGFVWFVIIALPNSGGWVIRRIFVNEAIGSCILPNELQSINTINLRADELLCSFLKEINAIRCSRS